MFLQLFLLLTLTPSFPQSQYPQFTFPLSTPIPPPTSYDLYASLHPGFHNYPTTFQPPTLPPNPLPPSFSNFPFNSPPSQPPPSVFRMTPSVLFPAVSDPIKVFDGLDHTCPPEKILAHLSAGITFQLTIGFEQIYSRCITFNINSFKTSP